MELGSSPQERTPSGADTVNASCPQAALGRRVRAPGQVA